MKMKKVEKIKTMSRLEYPEDGIYRYCRYDLESCQSYLSKSISRDRYQPCDHLLNTFNIVHS